ncbi:MAG: terminase small subunit [Pseudomonadota bacterium]
MRAAAKDLELMDVPVPDSVAALVATYPLPVGVPDADMNQAEIAQALNTTVPTVKRWLNEADFPVIQRGGMGKAYIMRLSQCYAWKQDRDAAEKLRDKHNKDAAARLQATFLSVDVDDTAATLTARQRRDLAEADFAYNRAAKERQELLPVDDVRDVLEGMMIAFRDAIEAQADRLEREAGLSVPQVELLRRSGRDTLEAVIATIQTDLLDDQDDQPASRAG